MQTTSARSRPLASRAPCRARRSLVAERTRPYFLRGRTQRRSIVRRQGPSDEVQGGRPVDFVFSRPGAPRRLRLWHSCVLWYMCMSGIMRLKRCIKIIDSRGQWSRTNIPARAKLFRVVTDPRKPPAERNSKRTIRQHGRSPQTQSLPSKRLVTRRYGNR